MRLTSPSLAVLLLVTTTPAWAQQGPAEPPPDPAAAEPAEPAEAPAPAEDEDEVVLEESPAATAAPAPAPSPAPGTAEASTSLPAGGSAVVDPLSPPPSAPPAGADAAPPFAPRPPTSRQEGPGGGDKWEFSYSGYFRAPMRVGIGNNTGPQYIREAGRDADGNLVNPDGNAISHTYDPDTDSWDGNATLPKKITLHRPVIPDDQYGSWQFTPHNKSDWAEMFFSVGNGTVSGTLAIQGFQFTDSSWKEDQAQFGIGQGWVEINHNLGFQNVRFNAKVGSHWARYGMAGIYDGGEYDTYLFGRTHTMGVTSRLDFLLPKFDLGIEGGVGAKQPDPEMFNRARFTTLAHGHLFFKLPSVEFSAHLMHAWSAQEVVPTYPTVLPGSGGCDPSVPGAQCTTADDQVSAADGTETYGGVDGPNGVFGSEYPNGTQTVVGGDARFDLGLFGYLYAGYSHQFLKNALIVDNAIESIHSFGGGMFNLGVTDNYLESPYCKTDPLNPAPNDSCSNGTGAVGTILAQYELGLANFGFLPGNMDLRVKLYGMMNFVTVDDIEVERLEKIVGPILEDENLNVAGKTMDDIRQDGTRKFKFGMDAEFFPLDFMSFGLRFDRLDPHNKLKNDAFAILSPRISFRTKLVTHEQITLQYSRYFYDQRMCQDSEGNVASPADDPFRPGSIYSGNSADTGLPLRYECVQPAPSPPPPNGFGAHSNSQAPGNRGAPTLLPDENVVKLEASIWW